MKLKRDDISDRVIQRLTKYLSILHDMKKYEEYINSSELSKIMNTTSAQIRRDLSTFGEFGIRGKGYDIENLISIIERILGIDRINKVILVGHGKVGEMLTSNTEVLGKSFNIVEVFDKSPSKVGKEIKDLNIKIKDIKDIDSDLGKINVDTAILSVINSGEVFFTGKISFCTISPFKLVSTEETEFFLSSSPREKAHFLFKNNKIGFFPPEVPGEFSDFFSTSNFSSMRSAICDEIVTLFKPVIFARSDLETGSFFIIS